MLRNAVNDTCGAVLSCHNCIQLIGLHSFHTYHIMKQSNQKFEWMTLHTVLFLFLRVVCDSLARVVMVFDYALAQWLDVNLTKFSSIVVAYYIGLILSTFVGVLNEKYLSNSISIFKLYTFVGGISSILFGLPFIFPVTFSSNTTTNQTTLIGYLFIIWTIFGISFSVSNFVEINIAADHNDQSKHGRIVAILSSSWTLASILYVVQGYIVEHAPGWMYVIIGIVICLLPRVMLSSCFRFENIDTVDIDDIDIDDGANMNDSESSITSETTILEQKTTASPRDTAAPGDYFLLKWSWLKANKQCTLILISSFFVAFSSGSSDVIVNPIFMQIYELSASEAGYASLSMAIGEIVASIILTKFADSWGNYVMVVIATVVKLLVSIFLGYTCLVTSYDLKSFDNGNSVYYFAVLIGLWYLAWELFYVPQLFSILRYVETQYNTPERMLLLTLALCCSIGRMLGVFGTTVLWDYVENHTKSVAIVAVMWIVSNVIGVIFYIVLYFDEKKDMVLLVDTNDVIETTEMQTQTGVTQHLESDSDNDEEN